MTKNHFEMIIHLWFQFDETFSLLRLAIRTISTKPKNLNQKNSDDSAYAVLIILVAIAVTVCKPIDSDYGSTWIAAI